MGFEIRQHLGKREKEKKTEEAIEWLKSQGAWPDVTLLRQTVLETYSLSQILIKTLHEHEATSSAAVKLSNQMEQLLTSLPK